MSKSLGNVVDPMTLADTFGVDPLRYYLLREVSFGQDGTYSAEAIVRAANADLANSFGNLAQRSLSMIFKNLGGELSADYTPTPDDDDLLADLHAMATERLPAEFDQLAFSVGIEDWLRAVFACNQYVDTQAPWALRKTDPDRMATVLWTTAEVIRQVAILAQPVMPASAGKMLDLLAVPNDERDFSRLGGAHRLASGVTLPTPVGVFPRHVDAQVD
eukprot:gene13166-16098_t